MWTIEGIKMNIINTNVKTEIDGKWYPARPLNGMRGHKSFVERIRDAWEVFMCRADAFRWPGGQ